MNIKNREVKFYHAIKKLTVESKGKILVDLVKINFIQYFILLALFSAGLVVMMVGISMLSMGLLISGITLFSVSLGGLAVLFILHKLSSQSFVWLNNIIDKKRLDEKISDLLN